MLSHKKYQNYLLAFLLISGTLKIPLGYYEFPYDITVILLSLILIDIFYCAFSLKSLSIKKIELFYILAVLLFSFIALTSILYSSSYILGFEKFLYMMIPLIGFIYMKFINTIYLSILYKLLLYLVIPIAIWFIFFKYLLWETHGFMGVFIDKSQFGDIRNSYLTIGYSLGIMALLSIKLSKKPLVVILFSIILFLGLGSRGALIFLILSLILTYYNNVIVFFAKFKIRKKTLKHILFILIPLIISSSIYFERIEKALNYGLNRFYLLMEFSSDKSSLGRIDQYAYVLEKGVTFQGLTVGHGLGSFGLDYAEISNKVSYPHNVLLESWYEMGLFSMIILAIILFTPFFLKRPYLIKSLAIFAVLNAFKSSSFAYDRYLFILIGLLIFHEGFYARNKTYHN